MNTFPELLIYYLVPNNFKKYLCTVMHIISIHLYVTVHIPISHETNCITEFCSCYKIKDGQLLFAQRRPNLY